MLDLQVYGIVGYIVLIIVIVLARIIAVLVVAAAIANYLALNGLLWYCTVIVIFLLINALISGLRGG